MNIILLVLVAWVGLSIPLSLLLGLLCRTPTPLPSERTAPFVPPGRLLLYPVATAAR